MPNWEGMYVRKLIQLQKKLPLGSPSMLQTKLGNTLWTIIESPAPTDTGPITCKHSENWPIVDKACVYYWEDKSLDANDPRSLHIRIATAHLVEPDSITTSGKAHHTKVIRKPIFWNTWLRLNILSKLSQCCQLLYTLPNILVFAMTASKLSGPQSLTVLFGKQLIPHILPILRAWW